MDGVDLPTETTTSVVLPEVQNAASTQLHVANLDESVATVTFDLFGPDGKAIGATALRSINIHGAVSERLANLFSGLSSSASDYIRLRSNRRITAFEVLESENTDFRALTGLDVFSGNTTLYSPQFVAGGLWQTTLSLINLDSFPGMATLRLIGDDGKQIGTTVTQTLPPKGKIVLTDAAFVTYGADLVQGHLELATDGPRISGSTTFSTAQTGHTAATTLPLITPTSRPLFFSSTILDPWLFTGLAIVNAVGTSNTVTIEFFAPDGTRRATTQEILPARGCHRRLLDTYIPWQKMRSSFQGYVRVSAEGRIAGCAMAGSKMLTSLAAIPAATLGGAKALVLR
jgi:hypothetical protein